MEEQNVAIRLKHFISHEGLSSSQFADFCGIRRPTLSQVLSSRNKKISDKIVGQIHAKYPGLSVVWLMFGEGEMLLPGAYSASFAPGTEPSRIEGGDSSRGSSPHTGYSSQSTSQEWPEEASSSGGYGVPGASSSGGYGLPGEASLSDGYGLPGASSSGGYGEPGRSSLSGGYGLPGGGSSLGINGLSGDSEANTQGAFGWQFSGLPVDSQLDNGLIRAAEHEDLAPYYTPAEYDRLNAAAHRGESASPLSDSNSLPQYGFSTQQNSRSGSGAAAQSRDNTYSRSGSGAAAQRRDNTYSRLGSGAAAQSRDKSATPSRGSGRAYSSDNQPGSAAYGFAANQAQDSSLRGVEQRTMARPPRKVKSITVFYDDNSYETFLPSAGEK